MELTRSEAHIVLEALRLFSREKARTKNRGDHPLLAAEMHKKMAKQVEELEYAQKIKDPYRKKE